MSSTRSNRYFKLIIDAVKAGNDSQLTRFLDKFDVTRHRSMFSDVLNEAVKAGSQECLLTLLTRADTQICESVLGTVVSLAVESGSSGILQLALARGADVNNAADMTCPPLHKAVMKNNLDCVNCLIENKADVNKLCASDTNDDIYSALHHAAHLGYSK